MNLAKEELHKLTKSTKESNKSFTQISESIASVGKSIGDGLATLAFTLSGSQQREGTPNVNQNLNLMYSNFPHGMNYKTPI